MRLISLRISKTLLLTVFAVAAVNATSTSHKIVIIQDKSPNGSNKSLANALLGM